MVMPSLPAISRKLWLSVVVSISIGNVVSAHEVRPAVSDVAVSASTVEVTITAPLEPIIAGMNLTGLENTDLAPEVDRHDALRLQEPEALETSLRAAWPEIAAKINLLAGETRVEPRITGVTIPEVGNIALPRDAELRITADLPDDGTPVRIGWDTTFGSVVVRQVGGVVRAAQPSPQPAGQPAVVVAVKRAQGGVRRGLVGRRHDGSPSLAGFKDWK